MQNIWTEIHRKRNMVLKHMKECLISSRVRKMKVKTINNISNWQKYKTTIYFVLRLRVRGERYSYTLQGEIKSNETKQISYEGELSKIINPMNLSWN